MKTNQYTYLKYLAQIFLETNFYKNCRENKKHTICVQKPPLFFFFEIRAVYEMKWENIVQPDTPQITIRLMRIACWILKATKTHSEYVILVAFPL